VAAVRDEIRDGMLAIEEARVHSELNALNAMDQRELSESVRERTRGLVRRLSELKHQRSAPGLAKP